MPNYVIFAEGRFSATRSKTGNAILRYRPEEATVVLDSKHAGLTAEEVLGYGGKVPVVASLGEALTYQPDTLLIACSPIGGQLAPSWREVLLEALRHGLNVVSGLHSKLADDVELVREAKKRSLALKDLRNSNDRNNIRYHAEWRQRKTPVVLTVGSDSNVGKMTTLYSTKRSLNKLGVDSTFIGTGQTGILLSGRGVAVDAIAGDFIAGSIESEVQSAINETNPQVLLVEGQGALTNPTYSGVTLGLLHGVMPDAMILVHKSGHHTSGFGLSIPPIEELVQIHEKAVECFQSSKVIGVGINGQDLTNQEYRKKLRPIEECLGLPTVDPVRDGAGRLAEAIVDEFALESY